MPFRPSIVSRSSATHSGRSSSSSGRIPQTEYARVERRGGAGDMGRDMIAIVDTGRASGTNFSASTTARRLRPTIVWTELGKLVYYTRRGDYTYPRRYCFVAPQGAGPKLSNLLKKPEKLRAGLLENWDAHCRTKITATETIELDAALRDYIAGLDF